LEEKNIETKLKMNENKPMTGSLQTTLQLNVILSKRAFHAQHSHPAVRFLFFTTII